MNKLKKPSIKNLFFWKSFLKNIILLMLPLSIISAYSLYRFNKDTTQTIEARNWNLMYQIKTQADSMFQTVDTISTYMSGSSSVNNTLKGIFSTDILSSKALKDANTLCQYLQSIIDSNNYSYSAYLYFDNEFGRFLATSNGLSYMRNHSIDNWIDSYIHYPSDFWIEAKKINTHSLVPDKDVICIYQKLYSPYSTNLSKGILITYYSTDSLLEYINNFNLYPGQVILFLQEDGMPLFQTTEGDFTNIWNQIIPNLCSEESYQVFHTEHHGSSYVTSVIPASAEGLYYVSLVPSKNLYAQTRSLTFIFLIITTASCILSILLSMISARHEYNQIQNIIDIFSNVDDELSKSMRAPVKNTNPYQIILHNVINLFLEQRYLKLQIENKQYQMQLLELRSLQHQINPHFLFNTLNTLYWEAIRFTNQPNTCSAIISDLSEIMAYSLTDAQNKVSISDELEYLQHYTNIQELRYNNKFEIIWDIDENALEMAIIKMVLQPLVENAIYHGIKEKDGHGIIKVKIYHQNCRILVHIMDNGMGISTTKLTELRTQLKNTSTASTHIGLLNTNRRLYLTYGNASVIRLYSRYQGGTVISFSIPAEKLDSPSKD